MSNTSSDVSAYVPVNQEKYNSARNKWNKLVDENQGRVSDTIYSGFLLNLMDELPQEDFAQIKEFVRADRAIRATHREKP